MAKHKIWEGQTTAGKRFYIGLFEGEEMLKSPVNRGEFKTEAGAKRALKRLQERW